MAFRNFFSFFGNKFSNNQVVKLKPSLPEELEALINDPNRIDVSWVKSKQSESDYIFVTDSIEIDADPETVLEEAKKVYRYHDISGGAITAHTEGEVRPGNKIKLELYKGTWTGMFILPVTETIVVAGKVKNDWVIGWSLPLPFGGFTQRYQVLEALPNNRTRSTIGDRIPGKVGLFSYFAFYKIIKNAFTDLNEGLKREVESRRMKK